MKGPFATVAVAATSFLLFGPPTLSALEGAGQYALSPADTGAQASPESAQAPPESAQGPVLTLTQAIEEALANNPRPAIANAEVDEARAATQQAGSGRLPRVDVSYIYQRTDNPVLVFGNLLRQGSFTEANFALDALNDPDAVDNFTPSISVVQPIWSGGRITRRREAAALQVTAADLRLARTREQVAFDAIDAYSGAVLAARYVEVAQEAAATADAHVELAESLNRAGMVVDSDVLQARLRARAATEALVRARNNRATAFAALNFVIGRELDAPLTLPDDFDEGEASDRSLDELIVTAVAERRDLRALEAQRDGAAKAAAAERAALYPEVAVSAFAESNSASMFGAQSGNWGVTVSAALTVFDGGGRSSEAEGSLARNRQLEQQVLLLRRGIALEVTRAFHDVETAAEAITQAEAAVELARESLRIVENRYREGMAAAVELLDAQTQLTVTRTSLVAARRDLALGRAALELAVGRDPASAGTGGTR